jgi:hypothetical protein
MFHVMGLFLLGVFTHALFQYISSPWSTAKRVRFRHGRKQGRHC